MAGEAKTPGPHRQVTKLADRNRVNVKVSDEFAPDSREGDIVVNCSPKSGTTWMIQVLLQMLHNGGLGFRKKSYLHRTTPFTMRCHGSKTHSSSQETSCLQTWRHPHPTAPASSNHIWSSMPSSSASRSGTCVRSAMGEICDEHW